MKIGKVGIQNAVLLAPMEDVTDMPFRLICKRLGADIVYTEFVNSEGLVRDSPKTKQKIMFLEEERPFGIQIYGGEESSMEGAAKIAESFHPDLIDINCGCWVKDVTLRGAGAALLKDLPKMERIVSSVVRSINLPVTVKTRIGWDAKSIQIVEVAKMLEAIGVQALTVHCRTRDQGHKGLVDYSWIPKIKAAVNIPIIVNGDLLTPQSVKKIFDETGCDAVMIGRGAVLNPWIFQQAKHYLATGELLPDASIEDRINLCIEHQKLSVQYKGERRGLIELRKHYAGYFRGIPHASKLRAELMQCTEMNQVIEKLHQFGQTLSVDEIQGEVLI